MLHVEFWMASHFPLIMDGEAGHTSRLSRRQKSLHFQECHIPDLWGCLPAARCPIAPFPLSFFSNPNFLSD